MLFLGHFSFEEHGDSPKHGYFTCLAEAKDLNDALSRFRNLLNENQKRERIFKIPATVYIDTVVPIDNIPTDGLIAHLIHREGEFGTPTSMAPR